jgi:hypothetical protein
MSQQLEPLHDQLTPTDIPIEKIFLDPNNPRFVGLTSIFVPDDRISDSSIQANALATLEKYFAVDRIRMNMAVNGYLPIDRIVVRPFGDQGNFVVLEGNRRIAAAKGMPTHTDDGKPLDPRVVESTKTIPALLYSGDDQDAAWLFQGIRHISGINDWSAYNKARLLVEQMEKDDLNLTSAGQRFGLTPPGAGQWVRSYYGFKQAKETTDYVSEVDERLYPYVQEIFGRSSIHMKEWLGWDESKKSFSNADLFNEFVGWFYPRPDQDDTTGDAGGHGDWEKKRLGNRDDIRQLSYLIQHAHKYFQLFRGGLDFEEAYSQAMVEQYEKKRQNDLDAVQNVFRNVDACTQSLNNIPLSLVKNADLNQQLRAKLAELDAAVRFVTD